ncbi:MAG: FecR domain-containing protein [Planctomycetes bacterium]|nr:FecR domain-containing protein [Planctomycetota bacterium]
MNSIDTDLEALFNRLADGIATEADEQRLGELLRNSPETRRACREFMALHSALHWDYVATASPELSPMATSPMAVSARPSRRGWGLAFIAGVLAASVVAVAVILLRPIHPTGPEKSAEPVQAEDVKADSIAALLVDQAGAEFAKERGPDGVRFGPGQYELLKGIVHLRFAHGAEVVMTSPARLDVKDEQHIRLVYGKVRVTAPPTAKGFTVATRDADYVDLGTEFSLSVDPGSAVSDLYVFDGQVNVAEPRSGKVLSEVMGGKSSRYVDGKLEAAPEVKEGDFPTPGTIGLKRWEQYAQELQKDRSLLAFFPFRRAADESVLVNEVNKSAMIDGRITGARWTTGRWPGKDALLFDRDTDFVQINIPGEHRDLTIAAWLKVDRLDFVLNAILNSDGYEPGGMHFQLNRQGFPRGGLIIEGSFQDQVVGKPVPLGKWTHVASVLSTRTRSQQIYLNGVLARERRWRSDQVVRPGSCRIGNWLAKPKDEFATRAFRGQIDELAIWNRALPREEVERLFKAGEPRLIWSDE